MSKNGFERAADLAQVAKAIRDIIKAGMKSGLSGAATAALKAHWPVIVPIVVVIILLPVIVVCCLPAILFGFNGTSEQEKAAQMQAYYENYDIYRNEQLNIVTEEQAQQGITCSIEYLNDSFDIDWLIAIDSVNNENNLNNLSEDELKNLIRKTYTYELLEPATESGESTPAENPWEDTVRQPEDENPTQPPAPPKIIKVTTLSARSVMRSLNFDDAKIDWATFLYETYSSGKGDLSPNDVNADIGTLIGGDNTPYIGGGYSSPFPNVRWKDHVSSEYGKRTDPVTGAAKASHNGIDIAMPLGTEIHAVQSGTVLYVKRQTTGYGYHLAINHGGKIVTLYAHCSEILVNEGDHVSKGDVIAKVGSTGKSTGNHLHLEFIIDGVPKNPRLYLPAQ